MHTSFSIQNDLARELVIIHEPECAEFTLPVGEEVTIAVDSCPESIVLRISSDQDQVLVALLGHKNLYTVLHNGADVFKYLTEES